MRKFKKQKLEKIQAVQGKKKFKINKKHAIGIFIAIVMILSAAGFLMLNQSEDSSYTETYKGVKFINQQNKWYGQVGGEVVAFNYFPGNLEFVNISRIVIESMQKARMYYIAYDPELNDSEEIALAQFEFNNEMSRMNVYGVNAFTKNNSYGFPVITCDNATTSIPVITFEEGDLDVNYDNNCIIVSGSDNDFIAVKDKIIYELIFGANNGENQ